MNPNANRRQFLGSLTAGLSAAAGGLLPGQEPPVGDGEGVWMEPVDVTAGTFHEEDCDPFGRGNQPRLTLRVGLEIFQREALVYLEGGEGKDGACVYGDRCLPWECLNHPSLVEKFEFTWEGARIPIPENLWNDLGALKLEKLPVPRPAVAGPQQLRWDERDARVKRPRLWLSADGGTALIEWCRGEECDRTSSIRWIISKKGTVLRHRLTPPDLC